MFEEDTIVLCGLFIEGAGVWSLFISLYYAILVTSVLKETNEKHGSKFFNAAADYNSDGSWIWNWRACGSKYGLIGDAERQG